MSHQEKIDQIKQLLELFRYERFVYMAVTIMSLIVLVTCAIILIMKGDAGRTAALGLFGSSGGIAYTTGRLLKMWSDAINVLQNKNVESKDI